MNCTLNMMNFAFKMMNFALKMVDVVGAKAGLNVIAKVLLEEADEAPKKPPKKVILH